MLPAVTVEHRTDVDNAFPLSVIPPRFFQNNINPNIEHRAAIASRRGDNLSVKITYSAAVTAEHVKGVNTARAVSAMPQHLFLSEINLNIEHHTALSCCHGNNRSVRIMSFAAVIVEHPTDVDNAFPLSAIPTRLILHKNTPIEKTRTAFACRPGDYRFATRTSSVVVTADKTQEVDNALPVSAIPQHLFQNKNNPSIEPRRTFACRRGHHRAARITSSAAVTVEHRTDVDNAFPVSVIPPRYFQNNINPNIEHRAAIASRRGDSRSVKITYSVAVTAEHVKGVNTARTVSAIRQRLFVFGINSTIEHHTALTCRHGTNRSVRIVSSAAVTAEIAEPPRHRINDVCHTPTFIVTQKHSN